MTSALAGQTASETVLVLEHVKQLLGEGQVATARAVLHHALEQYPTDKRLLHLHRAISPGRVVQRDERGSNRTAEIAWIKANHTTYRGKWVALLGERVIAIGDDLKTVLCRVREQQLAEIPLVHHLD